VALRPLPTRGRPRCRRPDHQHRCLSRQRGKCPSRRRARWSAGICSPACTGRGRQAPAADRRGCTLPNGGVHRAPCAHRASAVRGGERQCGGAGKVVGGGDRRGGGTGKAGVPTTGAGIGRDGARGVEVPRTGETESPGVAHRAQSTCLYGPHGPPQQPWVSGSLQHQQTLPAASQPVPLLTRRMRTSCGSLAPAPQPSAPHRSTTQARTSGALGPPATPA